MEASFTGPIRTILILVVIWLVLRMVLRSRMQGPGTGGPRGFQTQQQQRPKGEVRIERVDPGARSASQPPGTVQDADFEEVE